MLTVEPLLVTVYIARGSRALDLARKADNPHEYLEQAAFALERANTLADPNPLILRRLAEVYALQERHSDALATLKQAQQVAPESLLIYQQLGDLYLQTGQLQESVRLYEEALGFKPSDFLQHGDRSFAEGYYEDALRWYARLQFSTGTLPEDAAFRRLVAAWSISPDYAGSEILADNQAGLVKCFDSHCRINGADLRLLQAVPELEIPYGAALGMAFERTGNPNPAPNGWLWLASSAGFFVQVQEIGVYQLLITARHRGPPPARIMIGHNAQRLAELFVVSGKEEWQILKPKVFLRSGLNLLTIDFLNPLFIHQGEDRRLEIGYLELTRVP